MRACSNCGQWQRPDCVNECGKRGFAEFGWLPTVREILKSHSARCVDKDTGEDVGPATLRFPEIGQKVWAGLARSKETQPVLCEVVAPNGWDHWDLRLPDGSLHDLDEKWIFPTFVIVDTTTASMLCSVYDALSERKNKLKFERFGIVQAVDIGWRAAKGSKAKA